ncbi:MAG: DNA polymerase III subunit gamma/tau [Methylococcus sp.]
MAYQALARKWRPRKFGEIVGQDHVVRALTHALEFDRLHHAYLFTGTRGVGKTTVARILAKAMNCESRTGAEPCGACLACRELDEGRFVDLVEVDAASRTKVEDTRELLDNVLYAPTQGRYKVYLIDEVHMLSAHSFNALLKTLEEPPPHIKFLLATTDPQKIPVTVLSRCLQFNLKRLTAEQIRGQMEAILHSEAVPFEANALKSLARAADGSLRDGLSLMDQAIVHGGGSLGETTVAAMLGTVARQPIFAMLDALLARDAPALLELIEAMDEHAPNYADVLQQMLIILHHAALGQWAPEAVRRDEEADLILEISRRAGPEDLQLFYQIGLIGQRDLPLAPDARMGFEMVLLRMMAFRPAQSENTPAAQSLPRSPASAEPNRASVNVFAQTRVNLENHQPPAALPQGARPEFTPENDSADKLVEGGGSFPAASPTPDADSLDWSHLIRAMGLTAMTRELANNSLLVSLGDDECVIHLDPKLHHLRTPRSEAGLEKSLRDHFNRELRLKILMEAPSSETPANQFQREREARQQAAQQAMEQDEGVQALKTAFDARIVPGTVKPVSE